MKGQNFLKNIIIRTYAETAPIKAKTCGIQASKTSEGMKIVSLMPEHVTGAKLGLVFNAGSRYEDFDTQGMNHILRRSVGLSCGQLTNIMTSRHMQQMGVILQTTGTREKLAYVADVSPDCVDLWAKLLSTLVYKNNFYNWELQRYVAPKLKLDLEHIRLSDHVMDCNEQLHKTAFNKGLGNSLFVRDDKASSFNIDHINKYIENTFSTELVTLFGFGIEHELLTEISNIFPFVDKSKTDAKKLKFSSGECRKESSLNYAHVQFGWYVPGGHNNAKTGLTTALLAYCIDPGAIEAVPNANEGLHLLEKAGANVSVGTDASGLLHIYSDASLIGVMLNADRANSNEAISKVYKYVRTIGQNGVSGEDFERAKKIVKNKLLKKAGDPNSLLSLIEAQSLTDSAFHSYEDFAEIVENIEHEDVNQMAKSVLTSNVVMSSKGDLQNVPILGELN